MTLAAASIRTASRAGARVYLVTTAPQVSIAFP